LVPESSISNKPLGFAFNAKNREAQRIARDYTAAQITLIGDETKKAVRLIIQRSIREGIAPRDAAKLIKEAVGLNRPQMQTLIDYVNRFPEEMPTAVKFKAYKKYKAKLVRRRASMIARTETIDALNMGAEVAWKQAQGQGLLGKDAEKEWLTTPVGACSICEALNGKSVKIGEKFQSPRGALNGPTAHPNCRCGLAPVP
jgi:hypothetical protein